MILILTILFTSKSPPSRGAWIEIIPMVLINFKYKVAPLAGGVD